MKRGSRRTDYSQPVSSVRTHRYVRRSMVLSDTSRRESAVQNPAAPAVWIATLKNTWSKVRLVLRTARLHGNRAGRQLVAHWHARNWNVMATSVFAVIILVASIVLPFFAATHQEASYDLTPAKSLLESVPGYLQQKLTFDTKQQLYQFNQNGTVAQNTGSSLNVGSTSYSATLPAQFTDASQGITLTDIGSKQTVKLKPQFSLDAGRNEQGHVVYPLSDSNAQLVYSFKDAGVKEDIILYQSPGDTAEFNYQLHLPDGMLARVQADGSVGIFGGDPTLFGNISYGSDKDRALVNKAKQHSQKDHLYYVIPAPAVTGTTTQHVHAKFALQQDTLIVQVSGLNGAHYPLSIDPSFVMSPNSCGWQTNNNDDGSVGYGTATGSCNISRPTLSGGALSSWAENNGSATGLSPGPADVYTTAIVNGYMYFVDQAVSGGGLSNGIYVAAVNASTGVVGTPVATTLPAGEDVRGAALVTVNGYLYAIGGTNNARTYAIAKPSPTTGLIAGWTLSSGSALNAPRVLSGAVAYNGRIYVVNGSNGLGAVNSTEYATVQGDGSLSAWTVGSTITQEAGGLTRSSLAVSNGYLYSIGGVTSVGAGSAPQSTIYVAPINNNGSIGTWITSTTSLPTAIFSQGTIVANGYVYVIGGATSSTTTTAASYVAKLYASGGIGPFQATTSLLTARDTTNALLYNGKIYIAGGFSAALTTGAGTYYQDIQYATLSTALGNTSAYTAAANYTSTAVNEFATASYGGYLYVIGGNTSNTGGGGTMLSTVRYAPLNTDGSIGTWTTSSTSFNNTGAGACASACTGRVNMAAAVYNGYLYIAGGASNGGDGNGIWSDLQSTPLSATTGAPGSWTTVYKDFTTSSTSTYTPANGRSEMAMQIYNGTMYLMGGVTGSSPGQTDMPDIYYASLNSSGGAGTFTHSSTGLPGGVGRSGVHSFVNNNRLFIVGGGSGEIWGGVANDKDDVQFIPINSDGSLDGTTGWKDANASANGGSGSSFVAATNLQDYGVSVANGYLYISGGRNGASGTNTFAVVYKAPINTNGSLGTWTNPASLIQARYGAGSVILNGFLYAIGGCSARASFLGQNCNSTASMLASVEYAQVYNGGGGADGTWTAGTSMNSAIWAQPLVAANGFLYSLGGCKSFVVLLSTCNGISNASQYAPINADGSLGSWQTGTTLHDSVFGEGAVAANGYIYVMGGCPSTNSTCAAPLNTAYSALICTGSNTTGGCTGASTPGTFGTWNTLATFTTARWGVGVVISNGYIYLAGGTSGGASNILNDVQSAQILPNGGLGSWGSAGSGSTFTTARYNLSLAAYGDYLYLGSGNGSGGKLGDVQYAAVQANGALGGWQGTTNMSMIGSSSLTGYGGYLYAYGNGATSTNQLQYAPIFANGTLGDWITTPGYSAGTLEYSTVTAYDGFIYKVGGADSSVTSKADTAYAPLQTTPAIANYSMLLATDMVTSPADVFANLTLEQPTSTINVGLAGATVASPTFSSTTTQSMASGTKYSLPATLISYYWVPITIDDTQSMTFGESAGSSISYLQLNYHSNPGMRLRGGKTFNSGVQQSLDAQ
ncbi:MAG TPA: hypothetical protein VN031_02970 [Candidatus Microsaccharimonas sp.]|nr:hypothetical protein [Candidatus Microsaccharimonas sp.]